MRDTLSYTTQTPIDNYSTSRGKEVKYMYLQTTALKDQRPAIDQLQANDPSRHINTLALIHIHTYTTCPSLI
jgi:hypothetical protein